MQTYQIDAHISEAGALSTIFPSHLYGQDVRLIVLPRREKKEKVQEAKYSALDFLKEWKGLLKGMTDEELENAKYECLMEEHE